MRISLLTLLLTAISNTVKHGAVISEVGYFLMALVISRKGTQLSKSMKAKGLMRKFPTLSVMCLSLFLICYSKEKMEKVNFPLHCQDLLCIRVSYISNEEKTLCSSCCQFP